MLMPKCRRDEHNRQKSMAFANFFFRSGGVDTHVRASEPTEPRRLARVVASAYTWAMIAQIRKFLENGFKPFVIGLSDGRRFEIPARDFIAISPMTIGIIDKDELGIWVNPMHIVSVKEMDAKPRQENRQPPESKE